MARTVLTDPGIIPKIDLRFQFEDEADIPFKYTKVDLRYWADSKTLQIAGHAFKLKWCNTCTYKSFMERSHL